MGKDSILALSSRGNAVKLLFLQCDPPTGTSVMLVKYSYFNKSHNSHFLKVRVHFCYLMALPSITDRIHQNRADPLCR